MGNLRKAVQFDHFNITLYSIEKTLSNSFIYIHHLILFYIYASTEKEADFVIAFLLAVTSLV